MTDLPTTVADDGRRTLGVNLRPFRRFRQPGRGMPVGAYFVHRGRLGGCETGTTLHGLEKIRNR